MGLFENSHFPYTNFHELNLDKIVDVTKEAKETADRAETKADQAAATVGTYESRLSEVEHRNLVQDNAIVAARSDIADLQQRAAVDENIIASKSTVTVERGTYGPDDPESLAVGTITVDGIPTTLYGERNQAIAVEQGTLDAGVLVGSVVIEGQRTNLYAPTAGSTVVRAVDVPFNTEGVVPAMQGNTVQAAIEELNTDIMNINYPEIETSSEAYTVFSESNLEDYGNPSSNDEAMSDLANNILYAYKMLEKNICYDNRGDTINLNSSYYSGCFTGGQTTVYVMIPYNKIVKRYNGFNHGSYTATTNPIDNPNNYQWTLTGKITVRGTNGYILNAIDLASASISTITVIAVESGIQIKITVPQISGSPNNTPVNVWFSDNPKLSFTKN